MPKYGIIKDGDLLLSSKQLDGYKRIEYAAIPEFDQTTHYVEQEAPVEHNDHIFIDVAVKTLPEDQNDGEMDYEFN
ncbi:hypothetical protein HNQ94_000393 [Salirhabdus euzebyi]|uniref:Uncharacterized protein n=1 Tax=Salirhabdus euzebyi TaxID=394506 RepID=A0A841Q1K0_9BACI|nr:hypothetical protein [Salirhabdus euzebyi]MBB6451972.1 hypothetical protein [Salirhabdus euzebyi]